MDNPNPIYYKDLITPDDSITKLLGQLDELITKYDSAKSKIQGAAQEIAKGLQNVSGASEEQRKTIQLATEQSEKLVAEYRDVTSAQWKATQAFAEAAAVEKEKAQIDKLITQINTSMEGSYNRLSAQYRLNKIRLNEMSQAQREGTEAGRALVRETAAIYEEMKRLQEATGKHTLNVGNYADAAKGLKMELTSLVQQMVFLKSQGEGNSDEYKQMAKRAGELKDAMMDANAEVKAMASDTRALDAVMGAATVASGGLATYVGVTQMLGVDSETAAETQRKLGSAIAIVAGVTTIQNALQKESNLMTGIHILQLKAQDKAEALETATKSKNIVVTKAATVAQKIFNAVAAANPYVLLAIALVTVVGALVAFAAGASRSAKTMTELNKQIAASLDFLEAYNQASRRDSEERIHSLQSELDIAKARNASLSEVRRLEDEIFQERVKAHNKTGDIYEKTIANVDKHKARLIQLQAVLRDLQNASADGRRTMVIDIDLDNKVEKVNIEKAITAVQGQIDQLGRAVQVAIEFKKEGEDIAAQRAQQLAQRRNDAMQMAKAETDAIREAEDARLALIRDSYKRERTELQTKIRREIEDIQHRLQTETKLTPKAKIALQEEIKSIEERGRRELEDLRNEYAARDLAARRESQDLEIDLMAEGAEKERKQLEVSYTRQIEDLQNAMTTNRNLTETEVAEMYNQMLLLGDKYREELLKLNQNITLDQLNADAARLQLQIDATREESQERVDLQIELLQKQREIELAQNAQLAEDVRQNEADINKKWDAVILKQTAELTKNRALLILDAQQQLEESEFGLLNKNERQKSQFQLQQEKKRLEEILRLDKEAGYKMTEEARKTIQNTIDAIDKEAKTMKYNNIYEVLGIGIDDEQQSALNEALSQIKEGLSSLMDSWVEAADKALESADKQVEAAQKVLDAQIEAREKGYANDVIGAQRELALAQQTQQKALREKQKAQRAQMALDTVTQASSLITASANIWAAFSQMGPWGYALAIAAIAGMFISFGAAKLKAYQVAGQGGEEKYGEGTVELLEGGSHASGHDIDLGTKKDGTRRRAEGGEYFAVINKRNSRKYGSLIPDVINAFNSGTFAEKYQKANEMMSGVAVSMFGGTDVTKLEKDVHAIRQQGDESQFIDGRGNMIIRYKNLKTKILS